MKRKRTSVARDLRTPKYKKRIVPNKKRAHSRLACRRNSEK